MKYSSNQRKIMNGGDLKEDARLSAISRSWWLHQIIYLADKMEVYAAAKLKMFSAQYL